ncbi:transglutaminase domain-containing protein [Frankia sp. AgB32]|uniref:DUF4129 domain-containing transglutaminase family protein n=1 Tax=Frankia sp. AgB32 TaxID=631119 RepID=UPI00200CD318|nr:transglutaminase domain-containing protein [Frankia sp. AgB32]MCK9893062.1 transglutaminase domain-containing protein [Frankia sp. AgB32]
MPEGAESGDGAGSPRGGRLGGLVLVAGLALVGGFGFRHVFAGHDLQVIVPVAAFVPVILVGALGGRRRPLPLAVTMAAWGGGFVVWAAATLASSAGDVQGRLDLVRSGALTGWSRLLDTALPAPAEADLLLVPAVLTWFAAALGAELVVRTRTRLLPALPAAVLLTVGAAYAAPGASADLPLAGAFAALAATLLRLRREGRVSASSTTASLTSATRSACAVAVVVAVGVGLAGGPLRVSGHRPPADPRTLRTTAATSLPELSPLSRLAGWTAHPDQVLLRAQLTPAPSGPVALRLAVLDSYDGADWTTTARYLPAGQAVSLPPASSPPAPGPSGAGNDRSTPVTQDLTIEGLAGSLVPALARLSQFSLSPAADGRGDFAVAPSDGTLLRTSPLRPDDRLRLVSAPPVDRTAGQLLALTVSRTADSARYLALPTDLPPVLRGLAVVATDGGTSPYQQAALLRQYLMATFVFDPTVPAGHSLAHISHFLEQTRRGTSEQFATAFVLAARLLGLPARLVVGFTAGGTGGGPRTVRGADALAWAEIDFAGVGWLPFFPTPRAGDARGATVAGSTQGESSAQTSLVNAVLSAAAPSDRAGTTRPRDTVVPSHGLRPQSSDWARAARSAAAGTGVTFAGYLLLAWATPRLRRRRSRHGGDGRSRIVAAWRHAIDLVEDAGHPVSPAASPTEVVAAVGLVDEAGGTALRGLADLATLALFGDGPARWGAAGGRRAADEAWRQLGALERAVRRAVPRHRRLAHLIAPHTVAVEIHRWRVSAGRGGYPPTGRSVRCDTPSDQASCRGRGTNHGAGDEGAHQARRSGHLRPRDGQTGG